MKNEGLSYCVDERKKWKEGRKEKDKNQAVLLYDK